MEMLLYDRTQDGARKMFCILLGTAYRVFDFLLAEVGDFDEATQGPIRDEAFTLKVVVGVHRFVVGETFCSCDLEELYNRARSGPATGIVYLPQHEVAFPIFLKNVIAVTRHSSELRLSTKEPTGSGTANAKPP
jgi:hypothetical protein